VRYWLHLFQGRALERANRLPDAIASYRQAFEDVPYAPSVTAALGAALVTVHRDTEAARLAARAMTMPPPEDPWTTFGVPDARFWPALTEALRRIITP
jgi:predicted Zn-dependent protease